MSKETDILLDIRARIIDQIPTVAVFDSWAQSVDAMPYIVFGPTQVVRNHAQASRFKIYFVSLHLWMNDSKGSIAARDLANEVLDAVDMYKCPTAELDCYFQDHISVIDEDEALRHIVLNFEVR